MPLSRLHRARLAVVAAAVLFSTGGVAIKACSLTGWQVASFRSGIAAVFLYLAVPSARKIGGWRNAVVGLAYAATMVLFAVANKQTTAANAIFLQSTSPLYLVLLSPLLLREPIRRRDLPVVLAIAGGLALFFVGLPPTQDTAPRPLLGNVLGATTGVTWAFTLLGLRWLSRDGNQGGGLSAVVVGNAIACGLALPMALSTEASPSSFDLLLLAHLGVVQIGLAYILLTRGFRDVPAFEVSLLIVLEPTLNPVWTWLLHRENPGRLGLLGGAIILAASTFKSWLDTRRLTRRGTQPEGPPELSSDR